VRETALECREKKREKETIVRKGGRPEKASADKRSHDDDRWKKGEEEEGGRKEKESAPAAKQRADRDYCLDFSRRLRPTSKKGGKKHGGHLASGGEKPVVGLEKDGPLSGGQEKRMKGPPTSTRRGTKREGKK